MLVFALVVPMVFVMLANGMGKSIKDYNQNIFSGATNGDVTLSGGFDVPTMYLRESRPNRIYLHVGETFRFDTSWFGVVADGIPLSNSLIASGFNHSFRIVCISNGVLAGSGGAINSYFDNDTGELYRTVYHTTMWQLGIFYVQFEVRHTNGMWGRWGGSWGAGYPTSSDFMHIIVRHRAPTNLTVTTDNYLVWDAVSSATGYIVCINGTALHVAGTSFHLAGRLQTGNNMIRVRAIGGGMMSEWQTINHTAFNSTIWIIIAVAAGGQAILVGIGFSVYFAVRRKRV